ncbi:hypothetical protein PPD64_003800 [Providencia stuartii]|uniref:hypothetical protein n=1 Tax=Providencia TaxID=586 RepID=UPI0023499C3E|nr:MULTISPECIES: hypothetical protein [Providencia]MCR4081761.1 hypothetical protein [Providencia stuartii]
MKFSEEQLAKIQDIERNDYLTQVKTEFFYTYGDQLQNFDTLSDRLSETLNYLFSLGFKEERLIRSFLYTEACYPNFRHIPQIKAMLEEDNRVPEQQYQDYLRISMKRLEWGN